MDFKKLLLFAVLIFSGMSLWTAWQQEHAPKPQAPQQQTQSTPPAATNTSKSSESNIVPTISSTKTGPHEATRAVSKSATGKLIHVKTDVFDVAISLNGGDVIKTTLLQYNEKIKGQDKVVLLNNNPQERYVAQSGLISVNDKHEDNHIVYTAAKSTYQLNKGQKELRVVLTGKTVDGLTVKKLFIFKPNSYLIEVDNHIINDTAKTWNGFFYTQLTRHSLPAEKKGLFHFTSYTGAGYSSQEKTFKKLSFSDMAEDSLSLSVKGGWVSMMQHYFISAWIPSQNIETTFYSKVTNVSDGQLYTIGAYGPKLTVHPGHSIDVSAVKLYAGPAVNSRLKAAAPYLNQTIGYGWLYPISGLIFWLMEIIYRFVGNWGWSIILVTLLIKVLFYKLSAKSYRSMAKTRKLQPKITALKERLGDDKQAFHKEMMALYKRENASPMGGCLPMLIQIPVFIGLYYVLLQSVELRHAPFIFWIHDLSAKDPYYILPILMGASMLLQTKLSPSSPDPTQAKIMMFLPVVFTIFFLNFPSGLVLYWVVNTLSSVAQQYYIMRKFEKEGDKKAKSKGRKKK